MSAHSLRGLSDQLRHYLRDHKMPEVYEALLSGLCVMCPHDPHEFIINKLEHLVAKGLTNLQWDMFIDDDLKPCSKVISDSSIDTIFDFDQANHPSIELTARAYQHYNTTILRKCFNAILSHYLKMKRRNEVINFRMYVATHHYTHSELLKHFTFWINWIKARKGRQDMAYQKIRRAHCIVFGRVVFDAWLHHTRDAKKTREYFECLANIEKLERGENIEEDDLAKPVALTMTGEAVDSLSSLPRPVALRIFNHLNIKDLARCATVCRNWKILSQASCLWSKIDFSRLKRSPSDALVHHILAKSRPYVVHLNLRGCKECMSLRTFVCLRECRNMQDLNLSQCVALQDDRFVLLMNGCHVLLYLNISYTPLGDLSLRMVAQTFYNLQYLSLAHCTQFTNYGVDYLTLGIYRKHLTYIDISGCNQITPKGFMYLARYENLESIILNDLESLDDSCVQEVFTKCTKLTFVSLLNSPLISDEPFKVLVSHHKLKKLLIDANYKISDMMFRGLGKFCDNLQHVAVTDSPRLTDISLKAIAACKNLTVVNFADCIRITDTGVRYLTEGACAPNLRELNLTNCIKVGDMAIVNIHKRCHRLTYLTLCYCEHISEAGVELCGQMQSLVSLDISGCQCNDHGISALGGDIKDLSVSECATISDLGLQKFAQQSPSIEHLDVSFCQLLTDAAIKNLAFCCRLLTVLSIKGCRFLTDMSVQYLTGVCKYLSRFDVSGCILLTDKSTKYIKKGGRTLKVFTALYCRGISKAAIIKLSKSIETVEHNDLPVPKSFGYQPVMR